MKKMKMKICLLLAFVFLIPQAMSFGAAEAATEKYLDECTITEYSQYDGNQGDSFIYAIGKHENTRGNRDIHGMLYSHGIEAWIARWNYTAEQSWASATFDIGGFSGTLNGQCVLIDSYNTTNFDTTAYFYGDGVLLKSYRMTPNNIPFDINISLNNVKELTIYVSDNAQFMGGTSFGFVDLKLTGKSKGQNTGWTKNGKSWYYYIDGKVQTGWQKINGVWYYFNTSGAMQTGWKKISGKWYYFKASGAMQTGWKKIGGKWYFFKTDGSMAANEFCGGYWLNEDGTWTYKPKATWKKDNIGWYYIDTSGLYAKNQTLIIDGKKYYFNAKGYLK